MLTVTGALQKWEPGRRSYVTETKTWVHTPEFCKASLLTPVVVKEKVADNYRSTDREQVACALNLSSLEGFSKATVQAMLGRG